MAKATQPISIDGIEFDAFIEAADDSSADIPAYPTEKGFSVSDSIILKPLALTVTVHLTNTPVTWKQRLGAGPSRVQDTLYELMRLYKKKKPVTIETSDETYENMGILSINTPRNKET
ncbi:MAG: hypothetical protein LBE55_04255, partial [Clostridiales bacterium]|nr:hypothetical protein [Clostridiales bacterium]